MKEEGAVLPVSRIINDPIIILAHVRSHVTGLKAGREIILKTEKETVRVERVAIQGMLQKTFVVEDERLVF
jgi:hypothetical protein